MKTKTPIIALAGIVVLGSVALALAVTTGESADPSAADEPGEPTASESRASAEGGGSERGAEAGSERDERAEARAGEDAPRREREGGAAAEAAGGAAAEGEYVEYVREDGAVVRDHREGASERERGMSGVGDPRLAPETADRVTTDTVREVRDALRPEVADCRSRHAPDAEAGSALQARITFSVAGGTLTVDEVSTRSRGLPDPGELESCVEAAASALELDVAGAEDVDGHPIQLPFRIGPRE